MDNVLLVATYIDRLYKNNNIDINIAKMQKLLYLVQREGYIVNKKYIFDEYFLAYKYGPVLLKIFDEYKKESPFDYDISSLSEESKYIIDLVFKRYKYYSLWKLSTISHMELSWQFTRRGMDININGNNKINNILIRVDATRESLRRRGVILNEFKY